MDGTLKELRRELMENRDEKFSKSQQRFFKEKVRIYGVKTARVWKIAGDYWSRVEKLEKGEIYALCEELLASGCLEESFVACGMSYGVRSKYEEVDLARFEGWIERYVTNWATCDTFCNHTVGALLEKYPGQVETLKGWTKSKNMWLRRGAAVSLIVPAKKGKFLDEAFEIADALMGDSEDMVQKGLGWLLKEESRTRHGEVFDYIMKNRERMPRTTLRYALEKMPKRLRDEAMKK
jgi:3-methyladenine DNA glycosylase AlkD